MYTLQALQIFIFLIPGFISETILDALIVRKAKKELGVIIEALIFSMFIYTIYSFISSESPVALDQSKQPIVYTYNSISFLWLSLLSIGFPVVLSFLVTNDLHMKVVRFLQISKRTARASVWFDIFSDMDTHIIINFENGRRIYGWPLYYSNEPHNPYIFLSEPAWIQEENQEQKFIDLNIQGILITPEQKIESIEFLKS
ncbi:hypothetical protein ES705_06487 [subsurface metagenome]|nr:hypothetical protein [Clostridia bacterium]